MRIMNSLFRILAVTLLLSGVAMAAQQGMEMKDAHGKLGVSCKACHGSPDPSGPPSTKACLSCHKSYATVAAKTQGLKPNPHDSHRGEVPCADCHSTHGASRFMCNDCHDFTGFKMK